MARFTFPLLRSHSFRQVFATPVALNQHHVRSRRARATTPAPGHVSTDRILKKKAYSGPSGAISSRCASCGADWRYTGVVRDASDEALTCL